LRNTGSVCGAHIFTRDAGTKCRFAASSCRRVPRTQFREIIARPTVDRRARDQQLLSGPRHAATRRNAHEAVQIVTHRKLWRTSMARKYSKSASGDVRRAMKRRKKGTLKSGRKGRGGKVKSRKQAVAIGLSEARRKGKKVPKKRTGRKRRKRS
jgi:hypothetical protein